MRARIVISGLFALSLLAAMVLIVTMPDHSPEQPAHKAPPMILFVLLASLLGRGIEVTSRSRSFTYEAPGLRPYVDLAWELFVSMIFAVVIYLMFQGKILQGSLFPSFAASEDKYQNMIDNAIRMKPDTNVDAAKAIFWAFIAGYSAKFVPRLLSRAAAEVEPAEDKPS